MKDVLNNFISPVHGKSLCATDYIPVGDANGVAWDSPDLLDAQLDIIGLRRTLNKVTASTFILQTANTTTPNAQALDELDNGFMKNIDGVVETVGSILPSELTITNGRLLTGAKVGATDNVGVEIEKLPYDNLPDLAYKDVIVGNLSGRPEAKSKIPFEALPDHVPYGIITYDITGRPSGSITTSTNYVRGPSLPATTAGNIAIWSFSAPWLAGGRDIADGGISIPEIEAFAEAAEAAAAVSTAASVASGVSAAAAATSATAAAGSAGLAATEAAAATTSAATAAGSATAASTSATAAATSATGAGTSATAAATSATAAATSATAAATSATGAAASATAAAASAVEATAAAATATAAATTATGAAATATGAAGTATGAAAAAGLSAAAATISATAAGAEASGAAASAVAAGDSAAAAAASAGNAATSSSNSAISAAASAATLATILTTGLNSLPNNGDINFNGYKGINVADPLSPQDAATKAYVDSVASGVLPSSVANQVFITDGSNIKVFSSTLPAAVQANITSLGTVTTGTWNATTIAVVNGGTGATDAATARTNLGLTNIATQTVTANAILQGATSNGITSRTLTNGQILIGSTGAQPTAGLPTNGTNISWTGGAGTLTANISGQVALANGGTNAALTASNNGLVYSTASALAILTTANNGVLITSGAGVPSISSTLPTAVQTNITSLGVVGTGTWNATAISVAKGGTGATDAATARTNLATAPNAAKYIVQTADIELPNAQSLGALGTGILKNTTTTGVLSIATAGTDYYSLNNPTRLIDSGASAFNLFVGKTAGNTTLTTAINNTGVGGGVLEDITTGLNNTGFGAKCLTSITTNFNNTAYGALSLQSLGAGTGNSNTSYGSNNLSQMTSGSNNTALGNSTGSTYTTYNRCLLLGDTVDTTANNSSNVIGIGYNLLVPTNGIVIGDSSFTSIKIGKLTLPSATVANRLLYSSATNTIAEITPVNSAVLLTNGSGVPAFATGTASQFLRGDGAFSNVLGGSLGVGNMTPFTANSIQMANDIFNRKFVLYNNANDDHQFYGLGINGGVLRYQVPTAASHIFYAGTSSTTSDELARLTSNKNLLIGGTSSEVARVSILGGVQNVTNEETGIRLTPSGGTITAVVFEMLNFKNWKFKSLSNGDFYIYQDGTWFQRIDINGSFYVNTATTTKNSNSTWTIASDKKLKKDIKTHDKGLADILQLKVKKYKYTEEFEKTFHENERDKPCVGLIAQEVRELFPDCVSVVKDKDDNEILHLNPHEIFMTLITAVQDLHGELALLKQQLIK